MIELINTLRVIILFLLTLFLIYAIAVAFELRGIIDHQRDFIDRLVERMPITAYTNL